MRPSLFAAIASAVVVAAASAALGTGAISTPIGLPWVTAKRQTIIEVDPASSAVGAAALLLKVDAAGSGECEIGLKGASFDMCLVDKEGDLGVSSLSLEETGAGTDTITLQAPTSIVAPYSLTLPADDGSASQVLTTDGAGTTSWTTVATGITGSGVSGRVTLFNGTSSVTSDEDLTFSASVLRVEPGGDNTSSIKFAGDRVSLGYDGVTASPNGTGYVGTATSTRYFNINANGTAYVQLDATDQDINILKPIDSTSNIVTSADVTVGGGDIVCTSGGTCNIAAAAATVTIGGTTSTTVGDSVSYTAVSGFRSRVTEVSGTVTLDGDHKNVICDTAGGAATLTLPSAANKGQELTIARKGSDANSCNISRAGSDTITLTGAGTGQTNINISNGSVDSRTCFADGGTIWYCHTN